MESKRQDREDMRIIKRESEDRRRILNPDFRIFANSSHCANAPECLERFSISQDVSNSLIDIKWIDAKNDINKIDHYQLCYDDENNSIIICKPEELFFKPVSSDSEFIMRLRGTDVPPRCIYSMKICAVNGAGPGEWSNTTVARFSGRPMKPQEPSLSTVSLTQIEVAVKRLSKREECRSPVTICRVQYVEEKNENDRCWSSKTFHLETQKDALPIMKLVLDELKPKTCYLVRVTMANKFGESDPSCNREITTTYPVPGPPHNVRTSRKRTCKEVKVC